jgi:hypothetical protein
MVYWSWAAASVGCKCGLLGLANTHKTKAWSAGSLDARHLLALPQSFTKGAAAAAQGRSCSRHPPPLKTRHRPQPKTEPLSPPACKFQAGARLAAATAQGRSCSHRLCCCLAGPSSCFLLCSFVVLLLHYWT